MTIEASERAWGDLVFGRYPYWVTAEEGLDDVAVRNANRPFPREDGALPGPHLAEARTVVLRLWVDGATPIEAEEHLAALRAVTNRSRVGQERYRFMHLAGEERFILCRVIRRQIPRSDQTELAGTPHVTLAFEAADPRIYSSHESFLVVPQYGGGGGVGWDLPGDLPFNADAPPAGLSAAVNAGNDVAWPLIRFQFPPGAAGTCNGVRLRNLTNGDDLEISDTDLLVDGQILTADMPAFILATGDPIIHIAGSSRYGMWQLPREPFRLSPGANLLRFDVDGSAPIVCRLSWHNTYL